MRSASLAVLAGIKKVGCGLGALAPTELPARMFSE
jgi:hypothetical protein